MSEVFRLDAQLAGYEATAAGQRDPMPDSGTDAFEAWREQQRGRIAEILGTELPSSARAPRASSSPRASSKTTSRECNFTGPAKE